MKLIVNNSKCYWKDCEEKVLFEWIPSKNPNPLLVCQNHYDLLTQIFFVKILNKYGNITVVKTIPEFGEEDK